MCDWQVSSSKKPPEMMLPSKEWKIIVTDFTGKEFIKQVNILAITEIYFKYETVQCKTDPYREREREKKKDAS